MKACLGNGWAGATGLGVERESQGKKDAGWWVQARSRRALPASLRNLDFAGQKEPMKFLVRGVTSSLLCVTKIALAAACTRADA